MGEVMMLRLALATAVAGIILLFIISANSRLGQTSIYDLEDKAANSRVRVAGRITAVQDSEKILIVHIAEERPVSILVFKGSKINMSIGQNADVLGRIQEYRGKKEIIAEKISIRK